ncbi:GNAT family N-acetyltransferase [Peribacillus sp. Bi134]|uniref:GNAT family N-acetyltransferase n=1 Tax=Peribacillus sp. Bi134 TaxID=2884272 RepID=UPI001D6BAE16|nr:GNAT family N-acetyltransferase [Peribacillus sp. Bi134]CAH0314211.1 Acetyltransferase YpeA [Peribacillus sp. Bi134]
MLIREIKPEDTESFDLLMKQVETEADFMLMEPGERKGSPEQQRKWLERVDKENNSTVLVAEQGGQLVGYLAVIGGDTRRTKHSAYLVIGILKEYTGRGIGTNLFQRLEEWAITHNILRLELTVVIQNEAGVSLYKKMGYEIEGIKRNSLLINDTLFDQYFMSKLL